MKNLRKYLITLLCLVGIMVIGAVSAFAETTLTESEARQKIWDTMWDMATVVWTPSTEITYTHASVQVPTKVYNVGTIYVGMPYTQSSGSLSRFKSGFTDAVTATIFTTFQNWLPTTAQSTSYDEETGDPIYETDTIDIIMGNDCSGAVYWALSSVADVSFTGTSSMYELNDNGLVFPVVDSTDVTSFSEINKLISEISKNTSLDKENIYDTRYTSKTSALKASSYEIVNTIGLTQLDMDSYYATLKKGDVLVSNYPAGAVSDRDDYWGHVVLVESVDTVNKTVTFIQHGGAGIPGRGAQYTYKLKENVAEDQKTNAEALWNYGYASYDELFAHYYLPMTLECFADSTVTLDGDVSIDVKETGKLYLTSGTVTATNSRLESVTIEIYNESDTELVDEVTLYAATYRFGLFGGQGIQRNPEYSMSLSGFAPYLAAMDLKTGTNYIYKLSAKLADGTTHELKSFAFTY